MMGRKNANRAAHDQGTIIVLPLQRERQDQLLYFVMRPSIRLRPVFPPPFRSLLRPCAMGTHPVPTRVDAGNALGVRHRGAQERQRPPVLPARLLQKLPAGESVEGTNFFRSVEGGRALLLCPPASSTTPSVKAPPCLESLFVVSSIS